MKIKLTQWRVRLNGKDYAMFTPFMVNKSRFEERATAMGVAVATFDGEITELEDEGLEHQELTAQQMHVADPRFCPECEGWGDHDSGCERAKDGAIEAAEQKGDMMRDEA